VPLGGTGCLDRTRLGAERLMMAAIRPLPSLPPATRMTVNWTPYCYLAPYVAAAALQPRQCDHARDGEDVWDTALDM